MRMAMLVAVLGAMVMGCNYYGPDNPPPPDPEAVIKIHQVDTYTGQGVDGALCPTGSKLVGGGCDCWSLAPNCGGFAVMAVCTPAGNGMIGVCSTNCGGVTVHALCESATNANVTQGLSAPDAEFESALGKYQKTYR